MQHDLHALAINATPARVYRLLADVEAWQSLFPHVRDVATAGSGRWRIICIWKWIPLSVYAAARGDHAGLEFRFRRWPRIRVSWLWVVRPAADGTTSVHLTGTVVSAPLFCSRLVATVNRDLAVRTLQMIQLLAEADEIAHEGIEH